MNIDIKQLMITSGVQFGTSGVRGCVADMTDEVCWAYTTAFLRYLKDSGLGETSGEVGIAGDLRDSSPSIMQAVATAVRDQGLQPINYGMIPSPALALYGFYRAIPTIMVTGSHIPDDRNGIKFNTAYGEILKSDEEIMSSYVVTLDRTKFTSDGALLQRTALPPCDHAAQDHYIARFIDFFPAHCLQGKYIGLYQHSSVAWRCLQQILQALGADVTLLGRADHFVSVDTEAVRKQDVILAKNWVKSYGFDCIISTDGDGDRPLISDEHGNWLRGDVAAMLCAHYLNIDIVVTPISSNSMVEASQLFKQVIRSRIGSPYVIAAMKNAQGGTVAGYEANGGFLQYTDVQVAGSILTALPTRDAVIVVLTILMLATKKNMTIAELLDTLPPRFTYSDRLTEFPLNLSQQILASMTAHDNDRNFAYLSDVFSEVGRAVYIDQTDGLRVTFDNGEIVHLRPSGNAPELRCYNEADSKQRAQELNQLCMDIMATWR